MIFMKKITIEKNFSQFFCRPEIQKLSAASQETTILSV